MNKQERFRMPRCLVGDPAARAVLLALSMGMSMSTSACGDRTALPESGAVLLSVTLPAGAAEPEELRAWIYDKNGVLFKNARVPAQGALPVKSGTTLGTILIQPGVTVGDLRVHLRSFVAQRRQFDGIVVVTSRMRGLPLIAVVMDPKIPADVDLDDVPDVIDDCLPGFNPDQGGCVPAGGGGDAAADTRPGTDGGTATDAGSIGGTGGGSPDAGADAGTGGAGVGGTTGAGGSPGTGGSTGAGGRGWGSSGSPGCGTPVTGTGEGYVSLVMNEGGSAVDRQYWLSRPSDYSPQRSYKLVIALGAPASSVDAVRQQVGVQAGGAAGAADEIFAYPLSRIRNFGSWGTSYGWQLGPGARDTNGAGLDDLAFIDAMYDDITNRHCVDTRRVFIVGFGWGSDFANALACVRGNRLRAIAGAANNGDAYLTNPPVSCVGQVGTWIFQGKGDTNLGLNRGAVTLSYWLNRHSCSRNARPLSVLGPNGPEDCLSFDGCNAETRWCAYDASFGGAGPSYLGREALGFFRGF